jgi:hypothetical protein
MSCIHVIYEGLHVRIPFFVAWRVENQGVAVEEERPIVGERVCEKEGGREVGRRKKREERERERDRQRNFLPDVSENK